ncbi:amidohydrolase [Arthrobacter sp. zg-Y820]|uniref:amidohydrolase n=1 Tax=unclassified Arthrobacter TaxID=235627 RepID=UPI001E41E463|nr:MULTISPECIES: amidohydrolase [unclassified Arthrobacter]MCC9195521.1 amidohydrolase [Arthrobacter sp. zg-Y820]MDK1278380.1 amidohydrolase [Arthrobacter sp. zg.Y820]MDK1360069.1 amidohydrolase [Arthrobacter sp. zg-Y1219]WIB11059.1 amidohydrolase [Arthrobacter sp. zg-Y820]
MRGSVAPLLGELIAFRRDLHRHPELSTKEFRTTDRIVEALASAGLHPVRLEGTGAYVDIGDGPLRIGLRADIDALPVLEETGLPYASVNTGITHACGHDIHTTVMVGVAQVLARLNAAGNLGGRVRIIFQPAEEVMPGGALGVIRQGVLEGMPRIVALHCDPRIDVGQVGTRIGAITSASDTIRIELTGRGGHTSRPHLTEDLVFALAEIAVSVPAVLSRRIDVRSGVSVVWGQMHAGSAPNAIPGHGFMSGTMRCLDAEAWYAAGELLDDVVRQIAAPFRVDVTMEHTRGVPPVINTDAETSLIEAAARAELGEDSIVLAPQSMGGEDFAWMTQAVPGALMRLGTRTPGGETFDLHRGDYNPDELAISSGVSVMAAAAVRAARGLRH